MPSATLPAINASAAASAAPQSDNIAPTSAPLLFRFCPNRTSKNTHSEPSSILQNMADAPFEAPSNPHQAHLASSPALTVRLPRDLNRALLSLQG